MAERAHPEYPGFRDKLFGLSKSKYKSKLYERYNFCNQFINNKSVLDIPCGTGWGTSLLKDTDFIFGIDISNDAIDYAKKHYEKKKRQFSVGSMEAIPLKDNSFDVIVCLEGLEHIPKNKGISFINECKRVLKKSGSLLITCPVLNEAGETTGNPYHIYEYPERELIEIYNKNFRISSLERIIGPDGPEYRVILVNIKDKRYENT